MSGYILFFVILLLNACDFNPSGIDLQPEWKAQSLAAWRDHQPDMMAFSRDGKHLYIALKTKSDLLSPSLISIDMKSGKQRTLIFGLHRPDTLELAPDGSLWLGEGASDGLLWRIAEPDKLPDEQRVDRAKLQTSHPAIAPLRRAGVLAHGGLTFSADGRFAYMADKWERGSLYRYDIRQHKLYTLHQKRGWLEILNPESARLNAEKLQGQQFNRIEDLERLPDGRILMAEAGSGRILVFDDTAQQPGTERVKTWLEHDNLITPNNLAWDKVRNWLWITDGSKPSKLWVWDRRELYEIARHKDATISGVSIYNEDAYINLQSGPRQAEILLKLHEQLENH